MQTDMPGQKICEVIKDNDNLVVRMLASPR
jgi:hypothetical protein